jgi:hypothetical protein
MIQVRQYRQTCDWVLSKDELVHFGNSNGCTRKSRVGACHGLERETNTKSAAPLPLRFVLDLLMRDLRSRILCQNPRDNHAGRKSMAHLDA